MDHLLNSTVQNFTLLQVLFLIVNVFFLGGVSVFFLIKWLDKTFATKNDLLVHEEKFQVIFNHLIKTLDEISKNLIDTRLVVKGIETKQELYPDVIDAIKKIKSSLS